MTLRRVWVPQPTLGVGEETSPLRLGTSLHKRQHALSTLRYSILSLRLSDFALNGSALGIRTSNLDYKLGV